MTADIQSRLARLQNRRTRYEVVLQRTTGEKILLGYTARVTRDGLFERISASAAKVTTLLGIAPNSEGKFGGNGRLGHTFTFTAGDVVKFSGRTQRDSILEGELPWIGELVSG